MASVDGWFGRWRVCSRTLTLKSHINVSKFMPVQSFLSFSLILSFPFFGFLKFSLQVCDTLRLRSLLLPSGCRWCRQLPLFGLILTEELTSQSVVRLRPFHMSFSGKTAFRLLLFSDSCLLFFFPPTFFLFPFTLLVFNSALLKLSLLVGLFRPPLLFGNPFPLFLRFMFDTTFMLSFLGLLP